LALQSSGSAPMRSHLPCGTVVREVSERERRGRHGGCEPVRNHCEKPGASPVMPKER
jgi:hypothetical protein